MNEQNESDLTLSDSFCDMQKEEADTEAENLTDENRDEWFIEDRNKFLEKYPQIQSDELFTDHNFIKYANGKVGRESMIDIYNSYRTFYEDIEKSVLQKAEKEFASRISKAKATPGSLTENTQTTDSLYTLEELKNMSRKSIEANWDKVQRSIKNLKRGK